MKTFRRDETSVVYRFAPITLTPLSLPILRNQVYACMYTVITRGSQPLKRSIIYAGCVTALGRLILPLKRGCLGRLA